MKIPEALAGLPVASQLKPSWFNHQNIVAVSATGSGKTMIVPAAEATAKGGVVLCRQPTRLTCASVTPYLAQCWSNLNVGISTRDLKENLDDANLVIYSDGSLPSLLDRYGDNVTAVYFDEAHVMSEGSEIELALCKARGLPIRLLSATIDPSAFIEYLGEAKSIELTGRTFPITRDLIVAPDDLLHRADHGSLYGFIDDIVDQLLSQGTNGLIFLPTKDLCGKAAARASRALNSRTCHGGDNPREVQSWMEESDSPWLLCATVAAATGVTLDIDDVWICDEEISGHQVFGVEATLNHPLNDNTLMQMAGRVGRTREGVATLVVPQANGRPVPSNRDWLSAQPGYVRTPVAPRPVTPPCSKTTPYSVLVQMASVGIKRHEIDLLSTLDDRELDHAEEWLWRNGVIQAGELTRLGKRIAAFPMAPREAHLVLGAPTQDLQLVLCAALVFGNTYSAVRIKPGKDSWEKRGADPGWSIWPRNCQVWGSVPLTLAATLAKFSAEPYGWAASVNLNDRPLSGAQRDFEAAAAHICDEPLKALQAVNFWAQGDALWEHLRKHPLMKEMRSFRGKAQPSQPFSPLDSVFVEAWDLENRPIDDSIVGIKRKQAGKKAGYFFYPVGMFQFSPRSRP